MLCYGEEALTRGLVFVAGWSCQSGKARTRGPWVSAGSLQPWLPQPSFQLPSSPLDLPCTSPHQWGAASSTRPTETLTPLGAGEHQSAWTSQWHLMAESHELVYYTYTYTYPKPWALKDLPCMNQSNMKLIHANPAFEDLGLVNDVNDWIS